MLKDKDQIKVTMLYLPTPEHKEIKLHEATASLNLLQNLKSGLS